MKIGVVTCLWQRPQLAAEVMRHWSVALARVGGIGAAVVSEPEMAALAASCGWRAISHANEPLGAKFCRGTASFRGQVDAVVITGSDCLASPNILEVYERLLGKHAYFGLSDTAVVDVGNRNPNAMRVHYTEARAGEPMGSGRCLRSDVLDKTDWMPWPEISRRGLDGAMTRLLEREGVWAHSFSQRDIAVTMAECKTPTNMTPWSQLARLGHETIPAVDVWRDLNVTEVLGWDGK